MNLDRIDSAYRNIWSIGDIHGCLDELKALLSKVEFDSSKDMLLLCGDLVNRGPKSWLTLEFLAEIGDAVEFVWGNHDLYFLSQPDKFNTLSSYQGVLDQPITEKNQLLDFFKKGQILIEAKITDHNDTIRHFLITHAGIHPDWTLQQVREYARFSESVLTSNFQNHEYSDFLKGNESDIAPIAKLEKDAKLRTIVNCFTRMRMLDGDANLILDYASPEEITQQAGMPWFQFPHKTLKSSSDIHLLFGHWASLGGITNTERIFALDTGCVWGEKLTALNLRTMQRIFQPSLSAGKK